MTPHFSDEWLTVYAGDCRDVLPELAADSVDCIVTSPPYWGLRDYGTDGQLGLEPTPEEYVANLVAVFRELRRVLKPSGTCWLNLGDSYNSTFTSNKNGISSGLLNDGRRTEESRQRSLAKTKGQGQHIGRGLLPGLKPKDLVGIPWRVAFALQADGWYLRSDIIWSKPNPMPESVTDRPTKAHEYLFLLTKSARYFYDADAVREAHAYDWTANAAAMHRQNGERRARTDVAAGGITGEGGRDRQYINGPNPAGRNLRSVWTIATRPYPGAHFAVFPPELPERCIKAGSSERGVCPDCGAPWERVVERTPPPDFGRGTQPKNGPMKPGEGARRNTSGGLHPIPARTTGWRPSCAHNYPRDFSAGQTPDDFDPLPSVILDPFAGSGTVGLVAQKLNRRAILIDLNPDYILQAMQRNAQTPLGLGA